MTPSNTDTTTFNNNANFMPGTAKYKTKYTRSTQTTALQENTENECTPFFISIPALDPSSKRDLARLGLLASTSSSSILLLRKKHFAYLRRPLYAKHVQMLPGSYLTLDSSRPWIMYWTLHGLDLLDDLPDEDTLKGIVHTLEACWTNVNNQDESQGGGFGGGVGQLPHCATTYAAVNALSIIAGCDKGKYPDATRLALDLLERKREALLIWFLTLRYERRLDADSAVANGDGTKVMACAYRMHHDGELDVRATYCICSVASLLNILTEELMSGMMEHIVSCQTYEGGFGGEPFAEAHGGYTFCALGALQILIKATQMEGLGDSGVDNVALRDWLVNRQMGYEGGFQGRCNKLVDGCYTFWVGGAIAILGLDGNGSENRFDSGAYSMGSDADDCGVNRIYDEASQQIIDNEGEGGLLFDQSLLQRYVHLCAQDVNGGLRDKPSKPRDFYHSCYNLSGLSVSQHTLSSRPRRRKEDDRGEEHGDRNSRRLFAFAEEEDNVLGVAHPVYNIRVERVIFMINSFH